MNIEVEATPKLKFLIQYYKTPNTLRVLKQQKFIWPPYFFEKYYNALQYVLLWYRHS